MAQNILSRLAFAAVVACGGAVIPLSAVLAQSIDPAPLDSEMPRLDIQNVGPARQVLLTAVEQLQADRQAGKVDAIAADEIAVIDAQQAVMDAQIVADQTRMPQAPADVQAVMQARDRVLQADKNVGVAQKKLLSDRGVDDEEALREDVVAMNAARLESQQARQQWVGVRAQLRGEQVPTDPQ